MAAETLQSADNPFWESMGRIESGDNPLIWYLGGTLPNWQGTPVAIVVITETDNPSTAQETGRGILNVAIQP
jgi:hypothetical protein